MVKVHTGERPNQPPVSSVAPVLVTMPVKCTQRTAQTVGRTVTSEAIQPRNARFIAGGDMVINMEATMREIANGEISGSLPGSKSMVCVERITRNLGGPVAPATVGRDIRNESQGAHMPQEFGPVHSTPKTGEPSTWGRDWQGYAACKGNIIRTRRVGKLCKPHYKQ
nr:hypothetical protein SPSIL_55140 [Sporomusa silvacetica DSM 10669]